MKVVILCGGLGTRLAEETVTKPKPMVCIGHKPIIWHLIKYYYSYGYNDFILATGYKSEIINNFFKKNKIKGCNIFLKYTGKKTLTGGRILRLQKYLGNNDFLLTYGDGLSNINIKKLIKFHKKNKAIVTVSAVRPPVRFGELSISKNGTVYAFKEKPQSGKNWINGGFFVVKSHIFNYLKNDKTVLERTPLASLSAQKKLKAFKHYSFWQCMDTMRDKILLNKLWNQGLAKWKRW
jgi:glucose-1-phosphate cytidylyltransferase